MTGDTQEHVARALKISQAHVSRILAGKACPRPALALRLARYAQIPVESLLEAAARQGSAA